jgi:hypothetical protein
LIKNKDNGKSPHILKFLTSAIEGSELPGSISSPVTPTETALVLITKEAEWVSDSVWRGWQRQKNLTLLEIKPW